MKVLQRLRRRRLIILLVAVACTAAVLWYAESRRMRLAVSPLPPAPPPAASLTFEALVDSAASLAARYRLETDTLPAHDETRYLQATIDYLRNVTYAYYDWAISRGAATVSAETITREYLQPAVASVLQARPALASGRAGLPADTVLRLYFLDRGMLLTHGVILASRGLGRFPSLELVPIVEETSLDRVVWGRRIDAVAFAVRDPVIFDIVSYSHGVSTGANMVTLGTIVCHYLDREADFIRSLRDEVHRARQRTPPPSLDADAMTEGLAYVALQPYMSLDEESAITAFMEDWRETSRIHELGHIFSKQAGLALTAQSGQEEALAYLTELRYGGTPHYILLKMYNVGVLQGIHPHDEGMRIVFAEFARLIRDAKARGDGFETIDAGAPAESLTSDGVNRIAYQFPRLRTDEIRGLADRVFEEKYRPRVGMRRSE